MSRCGLGSSWLRNVQGTHAPSTDLIVLQHRGLRRNRNASGLLRMSGNRWPVNVSQHRMEKARANVARCFDHS